MTKQTKKPRVYIEEITNFSSAVKQIETTIPAFIRYTEKETKIKQVFPVALLKSNFKWKDVSFKRKIKYKLKKIKKWLKQKNKNGAINKSSNYLALFHGPAGTGKTLVASLLGKRANTDVYRIDLSLIVSKYIGETEKNISRIFDETNDKNWILFFDEADAIFGKRSELRDAHDKYANQEVSYLLQRIEDYSGLVIIALKSTKNLKSKLKKKFQNSIKF